MGVNVVIVESPAKAKTINKYLGSGYEVLASFGHVRDLPAKDGSVDPARDFAMIWELDGRGAKRMADIARAVKGADRVILATDPDREGEAISWHIVEALNEKRALKGKAVERVTFNAITKDAVHTAMAAPRQIDQALVDAYLARRALDYLVGFTLSPVLWRKLPGARSAGRVQSVALRLVCEREAEIERFVKREYWSLDALLATPRGETFSARLVGADGKKIQRLDVGTETEARAFEAALKQAHFAVASVESKPARRHPYPPFTTSTLQQEASRKLGFAPSRTMQLAQRLYEGAEIGGETVGLITYMRTDGVDMAPEAVAGLRDHIGKAYGGRYLPAIPRRYTSKQKNAQEAHEAIRPTDARRLPREVARHVDADLARLYELIWKRAVASQMESAELERTTVDVAAAVGGLGAQIGRRLDLRATGQVIRFDGFLTLYSEDRDDDGDDDDNRRLPAMTVGEALGAKEIKADQHFTEPPPRFTEASLVKRMEELGIGRPSTYASTLQTLRDRDYVRIDKKRLHPEDKGRLVTVFLESFFERYVEYGFTANLEEKLDLVSNSELDWKTLLHDFWREFHAKIDQTKELRVSDVLGALNDSLAPHNFPDKGDGTNPRACPSCSNGTLSLKTGKFGAFVGCSNYPECRYTRPLGPPQPEAEGDAAAPADGVRRLGKDAGSGLDVTAREGRFGPFVQLGDGEKPKRVSLPKGMSLADLTLDRAVALLALPKEVARHPTTGAPILVGVGRYGPYVQHDRTYANLEKDDDVLAIGSNRAIDLIVAKESGAGRRGGGAAAPAGRALGDHPTLGGPILVMAGRYGPYVKHGGVNATLPKALDVAAVTVEEAVRLLAARAEATGVKPKRARKPAARNASKSDTTAKSAPKAGAKKAPAGKKVAATKSAAKKTGVKKTGGG